MNAPGCVCIYGVRLEVLYVYLIILLLNTVSDMYLYVYVLGSCTWKLAAG